jgi:carbon monoxide dehydrogenase subunit G
MANTTFSGPVRSEGGFNVINKADSTGVITETGFSVNSTGQLVSMGTRKIQSFARYIGINKRSINCIRRW